MIIGHYHRNPNIVHNLQQSMVDYVFLLRFGKVGCEHWMYEVVHGLTCIGFSANSRAGGDSWMIRCPQGYGDTEFVGAQELSAVNQRMLKSAKEAAQDLAKRIGLTDVIDRTSLDAREYFRRGKENLLFA